MLIAYWCSVLVCLPVCGLLRRNGARPREMADSRVLATARRIHIRLRVAVLRDSSHFRRFRPAGGGEASRAVHPRELGQDDAYSSLASGKSSTPPARCIHRPQRDTSSAEYRLLVSLASGGASREPESRRSPAHAPHTRRLDPTFRYGAFFFVASALADVPSARLTLSATENAAANWERTTLAPACAARPTASVDMPSWRRIQNSQGHTPKPSQFCLPKVSFLRRKIFYDLRIDLRFIWYNGCKLGDGH